MSSFDTRNDGNEIVFNDGDANAMNGQIPTGSTVVLRTNDVDVMVAITEHGKKGSYKGKVICFKNSNDAEVNGTQVGDEISFNDSNIFCCESIAAAA